MEIISNRTVKEAMMSEFYQSIRTEECLREGESCNVCSRAQRTVCRQRYSFHRYYSDENIISILKEVIPDIMIRSLFSLTREKLLSYEWFQGRMNIILCFQADSSGRGWRRFIHRLLQISNSLCLSPGPARIQN